MNLSAVQRGSSVVLRWPAPALPANQSETAKLYIARVDVYRLAEQRDQQPILDPFDFEELSQLVGTLDRATIETQAKAGGRLEFADALNVATASGLASVRLRYAIRYVNGRDQAAPFSNSVAVEPVSAVASAPAALRISAPEQDVVELSWVAPPDNVDGTRPAGVIGYNIYRRKADGATGGNRINDDPVAETTFRDSKFDYTVAYVYFVRALSQGAAGLIESASCDPVEFTPIDTFKPAAPDPVSIASANAVVSLFWPTNRETDIAGYNIYRAESPDAREDAWVKLNPRPLAPTTLRDERVVLDRTYYYRVTAVDRFGNESAFSKTVAETVHP
jgi:hypothetical protein